MVKKSLMGLLAIICLVCLVGCGCQKAKTEKYTITFDTNGGSKISSITFEKGEKVSLPIPTREGYEFLGWFDGDEKITKVSQITKDVKLVAKWEKGTSKEDDEDTFSVIFNTNGGSLVSSQVISLGNTVVKPVNPTKEGYTFVEWQLNGKPYDFASEVTSDMALVAVWKKNIVYSYVLEDVEGSTTGEAILYLTKDNEKIAGTCDILTDTEKTVTKEIPVTGYRTNKFKIKNVTNIKEK